MNVPFAPVRGLLHTDYMNIRPDFRVIENPYDPSEPIALVPAIAPDVAVFHGFRADRSGNVVTSGAIDAKLIAQASRATIATAEEIVDGDLARAPHIGALVAGIHVTAVVHAPHGAHPTACAGYYGDDPTHIREYMRAAAAADTFRLYLERYVVGTVDHRAYLARVQEGRMAAAGRA